MRRSWCKGATDHNELETAWSGNQLALGTQEGWLLDNCSDAEMLNDVNLTAWGKGSDQRTDLWWNC